MTEELTKEQIKKQKRQQYMRDYMRTYKAKQYANDPEKVRRVNRTAYLKKTKQPPLEDTDKYGVYLHSVIKVKEMLTDLKTNRPDIFSELINL